MSSIVGVDIAKHSFDIATLQANGKYRTKSKLTNKATGFQTLQQWLAKYADQGGFVPALENLYRTGNPLVQEILQNWSAWEKGVPEV